MKSNSDFDDIRQAQGLDVVKEMIWAAIPTMGQPLVVEKRSLFSLNDVLSMRRPRMIVAGMLPEKCFASVTGPTGAWKSFFAINMSMNVACGVDFFGRSTRQTGVLYIAGEGVFGLQARFKALIKKTNVGEVPENLYVMSGM
ncbi:MAG: AAA family ATPase, partial [Saprospiraceae bacterium]|nr:AAA family ATPase [Saprospiraceae bacterium]